MEGVIWLIWSIFLGQIGYLGRIGHLGPINAKLAGWRWGAAVAWRYSQFSIDGFDHVIGQHAVDELELTGKNAFTLKLVCMRQTIKVSPSLRKFH
jgi:hypothetical protein